jgi:hypothetical protein
MHLDRSRWLVLALLLGPIAFLTGQTGSEPDEPNRPADAQETRVQSGDDLWSQFQIIVERNIFSRQRGQSRRERRDEPERPRYVPTPESRIVLKGIVNLNGAFTAFFEESGAMLTVRAGDAVARGKLEALTLDHVVFRHEDNTRIVTIGQNLEGTYGSGNISYNEVMEWSESTSASPDSGEAAAPTPEPATGEESDILKQMMERRRQQLGG